MKSKGLPTAVHNTSLLCKPAFVDECGHGLVHALDDVLVVVCLASPKVAVPRQGLIVIYMYMYMLQLYKQA